MRLLFPFQKVKYSFMLCACFFSLQILKLTSSSICRFLFSVNLRLNGIRSTPPPNAQEINVFCRSTLKKLSILCSLQAGEDAYAANKFNVKASDEAAIDRQVHRRDPFSLFLHIQPEVSCMQTEPYTYIASICNVS